MKIAVISDIHGNAFALKQVLITAEKRKVEKYLILGDIVGYYYAPDEVLALLKNFDCEWIQGNHERMLFSVLDNPASGEFIHSNYGSGIQMALNKLSETQIQELRSWPLQKTIVIDGITLMMCHGSPQNPDAYIYPDSTKESIHDCLLPGYDFVFMGHTHYPLFYPKEDKCKLVNPGSVGQNRAKGGMADWLLFDSKERDCHFYSEEYDVRPLIQQCKSIDPELPYLHQILIRNHETA